MEHSESIKELAAALSAFQAEVGNVKKDATNPFFKSKYATLENIISTIKPHLRKHGLSYAQFPDGESGLTTIVMHSSGEWIAASVDIRPIPEYAKSDEKHERPYISPQGQGSAITYARRYALGAALGIATDDDDDGNAASQPAAKAAPTPKADPHRKQKEQIVSLLKELGKAAAKREEIMESVYSLTGLELVEEAYDDIISRLFALRDEIHEN